MKSLSTADKYSLALFFIAIRDIADPTSYNRWVRGISVLRQKWNAAGRNALGTPIKAYGESVQRDLPPAKMPSITPHVCRHTYCSNMAKSGMNPTTLQYLMGHSDIGVTLNTYTHLGLEDAQDELGRIAENENARREMDTLGGEKTQEMIRVMG